MKSLPLHLSISLLLGASQTPCAVVAGKSAELQEWQGQFGGANTSEAEVITDPGRWTELWKRLNKPEPALDFAHYCAVVAFAGQRPTGGFTVEFLEPSFRRKELLIRWRVRTPSSDAIVTQALTQPWTVRVFPRPKGNLKVEQIEN
jgi:hypothetical protein